MALHFETIKSEPVIPAQTGREIVNVPASVRRHLEAGHALANQNRGSEAVEMFRAAGLELARTSPELFTLLMLGGMGYQGFTFTESEYEPEYSGIGKFFASVSGRDPDALRVVRQITRTMELIPMRNVR